MPAISDIPEHYTTEFQTNWMQLAQQTTKRFEGCVIMDSVRGKEKRYNQMDESHMQLITGRAEATIATDIPLALRWLRPKQYDKTSLLDEWDELLLGEVVLPTSSVTRSHGMAYNRTCDQVLIAALEGGAITGEDGTTVTPLPSTQIIPVDFEVPATNTGLTLAKLIEAKSILGKNDVYEDQDPNEKLIAAVSQQQLDDLLINVDQVDNSRYNDVKALVDGKVMHFMGFTFVRSELLTLDVATDIRNALFWAKSGAVLSSARMGTKMSIRDDRNEALQIRTKCSLGATRLEEKKVVLCYCDESPA